MNIKQGDTGPPLTITCTDNGDAVDLSAADTVKVIADGAATFTRTVTGSNAGVVVMPWQTTDTAALGQIQLEVEVTWQDGTIQTFPGEGFLRVTVTNDLG